MSPFAHPLWLVGFRPLFALACLSGAALPVLWAGVFAGAWPPPPSPLAAVEWHAHEMFFGFGWALLGGFLLTSTKNWVGVRGWHGGPLAFLAAAWLLERIAMGFGGAWPAVPFLLAGNLFLAAIVAMILWTLIRHRRTDSYADNLFFIVLLPLFPVAKNLMLSPGHFEAGWVMALGLFRLAFLLMLERTLTQFMQGVFKASILRNPALDLSIKGIALLLAFESWLPPPAAAALGLLLAALLAVRFAFWRPQLGLTRLDIGIMYLGYAAIMLQLVLAALGRVAQFVWVGSTPVHVFTFGVMGLIMPAMIMRIARGHTGRKVAFDRIDKGVLWLMILAFASRVVAPQFLPAAYPHWIALAAACWFACFALLAWRYIPFLLRPRVDGKEH